VALIDGKAARRSILSKLLTPAGIAELVRRSRAKRTTRLVDDDYRLKLYSQMLDEDFLHFGYFDDPDREGEDISFSELQAAQVRYSEIIVERVRTSGGKVLDVGCGMGGLIGPLRAADHEPVALTPDRSQIAHIAKKYTDLTVEDCKFEDLDTERYAGAFDTVINSESLQYIDLDVAISVVGKVLAPGGRWIICDFFRTTAEADKAGHLLELFREKITAADWHISEETDITPNILPTLAFAHMLGRRLVLPVADYATKRFQQKSPGIHFVLEDVLDQALLGIRRELKVVDPDLFFTNKSYCLFVLEKGRH
jgi:cyclopropane fatty-acyl-phospholipid synthase-like methyltransferase